MRNSTPQAPLLASEEGGASRCPPAAWEAYLLIGIFPRGEALRWAKAHVFVGRARPGRHCLSAIEALDGPGEIAVTTADGERSSRAIAATNAAECTRARDAWRIAAPGLAWDGFPQTRLTMAQPGVDARAVVRDVRWWARIPRVLSYFTGFGDVAWTDGRGTSRGVGLVEHAWGADVPVDVASLAPRRWQWDVLTWPGGGVGAALTVGGVGVRTLGRGGADAALATGRRARVRVREWREEEGRRVPARWEGELGTPAGTLRYEARPSTPVSPAVPGGGFVGTIWEGSWSGRAVAGTGFTEYRAAQ